MNSSRDRGEGNRNCGAPQPWMLVKHKQQDAYVAAARRRTVLYNTQGLRRGRLTVGVSDNASVSGDSYAISCDPRFSPRLQPRRRSSSPKTPNVPRSTTFGSGVTGSGGRVSQFRADSTYQCRAGENVSFAFPSPTVSPCPTRYDSIGANRSSCRALKDKDPRKYVQRPIPVREETR